MSISCVSQLSYYLYNQLYLEYFGGVDKILATNLSKWLMIWLLMPSLLCLNVELLVSTSGEQRVQTYTL